MGYRLEGDSVHQLIKQISFEAVVYGGVVQWVGNITYLLNDKQTIGGYTKIATVSRI